MIKKSLFEMLRERELLEYGAVFPAELVRNLLGLETPETATFREWEDLRLAEISAISAVRNKLLDEGKYLKACREFYRVLSPAENHEQAELYDQQARRKLAKGRKLLQNTPILAESSPSNKAARMLLRESGNSRPRAY